LTRIPHQSVHVIKHKCKKKEALVRLSKAVEHFCIQLMADGKSERTSRAYSRDLRIFMGWLSADEDIGSITPSLLARYLAGRSGDGLPISVNRTKTALRRFFRFLTDAGYIETDPASLIRNSRAEPKTPGNLYPGEVRKMLCAIHSSKAALANRDFVMFSLLLGTGMRLGSLVKLQATDVDLKGRCIRVKAKGGVERKVYFNSSLCRRLKAYVKAGGLSPEDPLFPSRNGGHLSSRQVQLRFKHWLKAAGIDPTCTGRPGT
jgi:integrase/recombinase XerD